MKTLKIGLIGYGLSGRIFHYPLITSHPGFKLSMLYTSNPKSALAVAQQHPACHCTQNIDDLFSAELDLVVITSPNKMHFEQARKALASGKNVLVEKPLTITSEEAAELVALSVEMKIQCFVFHNRRWDSDFKTTQKVIESGKLGNLREYEAHFDRFRNYKKANAWKEKDEEPGAGILYDLGPHLIDQALNLFGYPKEVYADIRSQRQGVKVDDNFELLLYYDGLKVTLKASMLVKENLPKYILLGDQGSFVKYGMDVQETQAKSGLMPNEEGWGEESADNWGVINCLSEGIDLREKVPGETGNYLQIYQEIHQAISGEKSAAPTAIDGHNVIKIIEFALESNLKGRRMTVNGML